MKNTLSLSGFHFFFFTRAAGNLFSISILVIHFQTSLLKKSCNIYIGISLLSGTFSIQKIIVQKFVVIPERWKLPHCCSSKESSCFQVWAKAFQLWKSEAIWVSLFTEKYFIFFMNVTTKGSGSLYCEWAARISLDLYLQHITLW